MLKIRLVEKLYAVAILLCLAAVSSAQEVERGEKVHIDKHILHRMEELTRTFEGISFAIGITGILQGTLNGEDVSPIEGNVTDFSGSLDLDLEKDFDKRGTAFMSIKAGAGEGLNDEAPYGSLLLGSVNDDAGSNEGRLEIAEAWYEARFLGGKVIFTAGKVNLTHYFDTNEIANDEIVQFLASVFVNNPAIDFPRRGPGGRLTLKFSNSLNFSVGFMDGDSDFENVFDNPFVIGELHVSGKLFGKHGGNYRFNVWLNESDHQHITVPNRIREEGYGFGMSFDQQMSDVIALFARFGWQDDDVYHLEASWSAGFEIKGAPWGREEDNLGLAFAQGIANNALPVLEDEFRLEVYYSFVINKNVIMSPDLQVVFNPAGDRALDNVVILGVRTQIFF